MKIQEHGPFVPVSAAPSNRILTGWASGEWSIRRHGKTAYRDSFLLRFVKSSAFVILFKTKLLHSSRIPRRSGSMQMYGFRRCKPYDNMNGDGEPVSAASSPDWEWLAILLLFVSDFGTMIQRWRDRIWRLSALFSERGDLSTVCEGERVWDRTHFA